MTIFFKKVHDLLRKGQSDALEDFLTELIAEVLQDKTLLIEFIRVFIGLEIDSFEGYSVTTQRTFSKLANHSVDSRPDMVIQFCTENKSTTIFLESKVNSGEGEDQLQRYADHLKTYQDLGHITYLLYVTRFNDPKDNKIIFKNGRTAKYIQFQWYNVYNWLKESKDSYIRKVIQFMEEIGLNESRKFLSQDIYAIQQMQRLQHMMDECLDGIVDTTMAKLFGKAIGWSNRNVQLRDHARYFKANAQEGATWVECGFHLTEEDYPLICVTFEVGPNDPKRQETIDAMKWFIAQNLDSDWESYDLDDESKWSGISADRWLLEFLSEEDHIAAIESYIIEKLNELYKLKKQYPQLGWRTDI